MLKRISVASLLMLTSCVNAFVPDAPIEQLYPGFASKADVAHILGDPWRRAVTPVGDEIWHYRQVSLGPGSQGTAEFLFSGEVLSQCTVHATVGILGPSTAVRCGRY